MERIRITKAQDACFEDAFAIYQNSFPNFEQRSRADQERALADSDYFFEVIQNEAHQTMGVLLTWQTSDMIYVEHFAVLSSARGQNIGSTILEQLIHQARVPIVLEIDPPVDEISQRRQGFYERRGFVMTDYAYIHPSYQKGNTPHQLKLMAYPAMNEALYDCFYPYLAKHVMQYSENQMEV